MRIVRFDEEVSIRVTDGGSRFSIGPLTGDGSQVRVQVVHVPPGGSVARHGTRGQQLFAVVAGSGWVAGDDGLRRGVVAGYGALWEAGEEHEVHSEAGLTAACVEGSFDVWALAVTTDIVIADYDPAWTTWFERVCDHVWPAVQDLALRIDHVGSTSVPGLAAKPIIDMDIVVASPDGVRPVIGRLVEIGYRWRGDLGVDGRESFRPPPDAGLPSHHLYLVIENSTAHLDHWLLRDLLRQDAEARERYAALKRRSADMAAGDIDVYIDAKGGLVTELLARARAERDLPAKPGG